jgi:hypothetical protein
MQLIVAVSSDVFLTAFRNAATDNWTRRSEAVAAADRFAAGAHPETEEKLAVAFC